MNTPCIYILATRKTMIQIGLEYRVAILLDEDMLFEYNNPSKIYLETPNYYYVVECFSPSKIYVNENEAVDAAMKLLEKNPNMNIGVIYNFEEYTFDQLIEMKEINDRDLYKE